ncbi:MAG TPA: dienelactone hydrolase family protein [Usitatibacter sp.]|jgi:dienelactone hydrolase|nr:dienelactone hydrolase family protein [Usitatibacter sp.]
MSKRRILVLLAALVPAFACAKVVTRTVEYTVDKHVMKGYLAYDDAAKEQRPGVLVVPEILGLNEYARRRTRELAQMGYVAFAADMYGDGRTTDDPKQAEAWSKSIGATPLALALRAKPGLDTLRKQPQADPERLAAIGFCFGGTTVLQLAYAGAHLRGVAVFHGGLIAPDSDQSHRIRAAMLILNGADDPFIKPEVVDAMRKSLDAVHVDWVMATYGHAKHGFTNPDVDKYHVPGVAYERRAEHRAWAAMKAFLAEQLK